VVGSVDDSNVRDVVEGRKRSFLIDDLATLGKRIVHYPKALKAFGKWDGTAEQRLDELKQTYDGGVIIANKEASPARRLGEAKPVLEKAEMISQDIASAAGFQYEGGCGADAEDFQRVNFIFFRKSRGRHFTSCRWIWMNANASWPIHTIPTNATPGLALSQGQMNSRAITGIV
jgi:hypothetical protein